jgi:DNA polymerase-3 subunit gamma/tau
VLAFGNEGKRKAFSGSGHDVILGQALIDVLGLDLRIDAVLDPATAGRAAAAPAPRKPSRGSAEPAEAAPPHPAPASGSSAGDGAEDSPTDDDEDAEDAGLAGTDLVARELGGTVIGEFGPG